MVEVKATKEGEGANVSVSLEGHGMDVCEEAVSIVRALARDLSNIDETLGTLFKTMTALALLKAKDDESPAEGGGNYA